MDAGPDFDFLRYIERRRRATGLGESGEGYAFSGDLAVLRTMRKIKPVEIAVGSTVRLWKNIEKNNLLGGAVRVSENQFPKIHKLTRTCAERLGIQAPTVYVLPALDQLNAMTFGTDDDAFVLINSATVDHMSDDELLFIIGHECGHVQNNHVVYKTALYYLTRMASVFVAWIVTPAVIALNGWSRRAEITCDRAGLLCCRSLDAGTRALVKFAVGSQKLYKEINLEEYLRQLDDGRDGIGRYSELLHTHPYVPKRVEALRLFAQSSVFLEAMGEGGGLPKDDVDRRVAELVAVIGQGKKKAVETGSNDAG
ncbi:MAG: M48 family metallopeptidase [Deltaproteobacteria bacterium]|nr:M48 family metallopeptidase [Deltaproteobacteria bacterium]